jgi:hypothetical protein
LIRNIQALGSRYRIFIKRGKPSRRSRITSGHTSAQGVGHRAHFHRFGFTRRIRGLCDPASTTFQQKAPRLEGNGRRDPPRFLMRCILFFPLHNGVLFPLHNWVLFPLHNWVLFPLRDWILLSIFVLLVPLRLRQSRLAWRQNRNLSSTHASF